MIRGRCPICVKSYEVALISDLPGFPFCSERCKLIDLGRWIDGNYAIPAGPDPDPDSEQEVGEDEEK